MNVPRKEFVLEYHIPGNLTNVASVDEVENIFIGRFFNFQWHLRTKRFVISHHHERAPLGIRFFVVCENLTASEIPQEWSIPTQVDCQYGDDVIRYPECVLFEKSKKEKIRLRVSGFRPSNSIDPIVIRVSVEDVVKTFKDKEYSDITLNVGGEQFHVWKGFLASHSDVLKMMFSGGFEESRKKEIVIADTDPYYFQLLLEVLHGENVVKDANVVHLMRLVDFYNAPTGLRACSKFLLKESKLPTKALFDIADRYQGLGELKTLCFSRLTDHRDIRDFMPQNMDNLEQQFNPADLAQLLKVCCNYIERKTRDAQGNGPPRGYRGRSPSPYRYDNPYRRRGLSPDRREDDWDESPRRSPSPRNYNRYRTVNRFSSPRGYDRGGRRSPSPPARQPYQRYGGYGGGRRSPNLPLQNRALSPLMDNLDIRVERFNVVGGRPTYQRGRGGFHGRGGQGRGGGYQRGGPNSAPNSIHRAAEGAGSAQNQDQGPALNNNEFSTPMAQNQSNAPGSARGGFRAGLRGGRGAGHGAERARGRYHGAGGGQDMSVVLPEDGPSLAGQPPASSSSSQGGSGGEAISAILEDGGAPNANQQGDGQKQDANGPTTLDSAGGRGPSTRPSAPRISSNLWTLTVSSDSRLVTESRQQGRDAEGGPSPSAPTQNSVSTPRSTMEAGNNGETGPRSTGNQLSQGGNRPPARNRSQSPRRGGFRDGRGGNQHRVPESLRFEFGDGGVIYPALINPGGGAATFEDMIRDIPMNPRRYARLEAEYEAWREREDLTNRYDFDFYRGDDYDRPPVEEWSPETIPLSGGIRGGRGGGGGGYGRGGPGRNNAGRGGAGRDGAGRGGAGRNNAGRGGYGRDGYGTGGAGSSAAGINAAGRGGSRQN